MTDTKYKAAARYKRGTKRGGINRKRTKPMDDKKDYEATKCMVDTQN
jgi:hypothetical protein